MAEVAESTCHLVPCRLWLPLATASLVLRKLKVPPHHRPHSLSHQPPPPVQANLTNCWHGTLSSHKRCLFPAVSNQPAAHAVDTLRQVARASDVHGFPNCIDRLRTLTPCYCKSELISCRPLPRGYKAPLRFHHNIFQFGWPQQKSAAIHFATPSTLGQKGPLQ